MRTNVFHVTNASHNQLQTRTQLYLWGGVQNYANGMSSTWSMPCIINSQCEPAVCAGYGWYSLKCQSSPCPSTQALGWGTRRWLTFQAMDDIDNICETASGQSRLAHMNIQVPAEVGWASTKTDTWMNFDQLSTENRSRVRWCLTDFVLTQLVGCWPTFGWDFPTDDQWSVSQCSTDLGWESNKHQLVHQLTFVDLTHQHDTWSNKTGILPGAGEILFNFLGAVLVEMILTVCTYYVHMPYERFKVMITTPLRHWQHTHEHSGLFGDDNGYYFM